MLDLHLAPTARARRSRRGFGSALAAAVLAAMSFAASGCGLTITAAAAILIATQKSGSGGGSNTAPAVVLSTVGRSPGSPVSIAFTLIDSEAEATSVFFEFFDGTSWNPGTIASVLDASSNPAGTISGATVSGLASSASGLAYTVRWDAVLDLGAGAWPGTMVRLTPQNSLAGIVQTSGSFVSGNDLPTVTYPATVVGSSRGVIVIEFTLQDSTSDPVTIEDGAAAGPSVEYSVDGGTNWAAATIPVGSTTNLATSPSGTTHRIAWDSEVDLPTFSGSFRIRITAADSQTAAGVETTDFPLDNANVPTLVMARTLDDNGDGLVDFLVLQFDEEVDDSSFDPTMNPLASDLALPVPATLGSPISVGDVANDPTIFLNVTAPFVDTGRTGTFSAGAGFITGQLGDPSAAIVNVGVQDRATPAAISAVTRDTDVDGRVDEVEVTFSEDLDPTTVSNAGWGVLGYDPATAAIGATNRVVVLSVTEPGGIDTEATPQASYDPSAGTLEDAAGNPALGFSRTSADGAPPLLVSASAQDADQNGRLDRVVCVYSEDIPLAGFDGDAHTLSGIPAGGTEGSEAEILPGQITIFITGAGADTAVGALSVDLPAGEIRDVVGNFNPARSLAVADAAGPVLVTATALDQNVSAGNGGCLDLVRCTWSEDIADATFSAGEHSLQNIPSNGLQGADSEATGVVSIAITGAGTDTTPGSMTVTVLGGAFADASGNASVVAQDRPVLDGAGPFPISAEARDFDSNGTIDRVEVTYSEDVQNSSFDGNAHILGGTIPGGGAEGSEAKIGPALFSVFITGAAAGTAVPTGSLSVAVGAGELRDFAANSNVAATIDAADGAGPVLLSAAALDQNADGRIDAVLCAYSENLSGFDGDAHTLSALPSGASEGTETLAAATVFIAVTTAPVGTAPGTMTVDVSAGEMTDAASNPNVPASGRLVVDGAGPALVSASYGDRNGNGTIDEVRCTYSEPIAMGSFQGTEHSLAGIPAGGSKGGETLGGSEVTILINGAAVGTEAAGLAVTVSAGALADPANNLNPAATAFAASDGAAPVFASVTTRDVDGDGRIDRLDIVYSEPVNVSDFLMPGYTISRTVTSGAYGASTAEVQLQLAEGASPDTGAAVSISVGGAPGVTDAATNAQPSGSTTTLDGAGPVIVEALHDAGNVAAVDDDRLKIRFSEAVNDATVVGDPSGFHFYLTGGGFFGSGNVQTGTGPNDDWVEAVFGAGGSAPSIGVSTVAIAVGTGLEDMHGAPVDAANVPCTILDAGPPTIVEVRTLDDDANGRVDHLVLVWSQSVRDASFDPAKIVAGAFLLAGPPNPLSFGLASVVDAGDDNTQYVKVTEGSDRDTGLTGTVTGSTGLVNAVADNDVSASFTLSALDGAPPAPFSVITDDTNNNGIMDQISVTLSEEVTGTTVPADWTVASRTVTAASEFNGVVRLTLTPLGAPDTGDTPAVAYAPASALRDAANWPLAGFSRVAGDGVPPILLTATIRDDPGDGNVEVALLTFSEPVDDSSFAVPSGFRLGGTPLNGFDALGTPDDAQVQMRIVVPDSSLPGTGIYDLTYARSQALEDVADLAGNTLADIGASFVETDGAGPIPVGGGIFRDLDQNGVDVGDTIEIAFSESLSIGGALAASHFALGIAGDRFDNGGIVPATVGPGSLPSQVRITLGLSPIISQVRFDPATSGTASTINLGNPPAGAITDLAGADAKGAPNPLDIVPGFVAGAALGTAQSRGVVAADLDKDGWVDLVYANAGVDLDTVWINNRVGGFVAGPATLPPADSRAVAAADVDRDGDQDVAIVTAAGQANVIFPNFGNATFGASIALSNTDGRAVAFGDFNGDGAPDIVIAVGGAGSDEVWMNNGTGGFPGPAVLLGDSSDGRALALGDVDRDGDLDIVVAVDGGSDRIWLGSGAGTFPTWVDLGDGDAGRAVVLADVDRDGDQDIVVGNAAPSPTRLYVNQGGSQGGAIGAFVVGQTLVTADVTALAALDHDLDGSPEIACAIAGEGIRIYRRSGNVFADEGQRLGTDGRVLAAADFDRDGDPDILGLEPHRGSASGTSGSLGFSMGGAIDRPLSIRQATDYDVGDLDGDGDLDLAVATSGLNSRNPVLRWNGSTFVDTGSSLGFADCEAVALGDLDRDGDLDAVSGDTDASGTTRMDAIYRNDGTAQLDDSYSLVGPNDPTGCLAIADLTRDGLPDVLVGHTSGSKEEVWRETSPVALAFAPFQTNIGDNRQTQGVAVADMDENGSLDIVLVSRGGGWQEIWLYNGANFGVGGTSAHMTIDNTPANDVLAADWNLDGAPDLVIGRDDGFTFHRNWNDGSGWVALAQTVGGEGRTERMAAADFDLDGDLDLVIAASTPDAGGEYASFWLYDRATGQFSQVGVFSIMNASEAVAAGDFDRDGDPDIIIDDGATGMRLIRNDTE